MQDHYRLSDAGFKKLADAGVSVADMFHSVDMFKAATCPVSLVNLLYYIDEYGGAWIDGVIKRKADQIALAVFNELSMTDKIQTAEYAESTETGDWA